MMSYIHTAARLIAARYREAGQAVYSANEPEGEALARSYKWWRQRGRVPGRAVASAALDYFRHDRRWPRSPRFAAPGAPFGSDNLRWCEDPAAVGLRFVGFADTIAPRSVEHKGWFTIPDGWTGEVMRGAVYQLPGRDGHARYVAGYRFGSDGKHGWADIGESGAVAVALGEIFETSSDDSDAYYFSRGGDAPTAARDAAMRADQIAERYAETEREYQEASSAAYRWREISAEMIESRAAVRQLMHDIREAIRSGISAAPSICAALRQQVRYRIGEWEELRKERDELNKRFSYWEGARSVSIAEFAADNI